MSRYAALFIFKTAFGLINITLTENEKTEFGQIMFEKPVFGQRECEWSEFKWTVWTGGVDMNKVWTDWVWITSV